jgi:AraC-like DNA-binding protein
MPQKEHNKALKTGVNSLFTTKLEQCMKEECLYMNPKLTISDVAIAIGTNRTYLSDYLNEKLGVTFYEYVNRYRVMEACGILIGDDNKLLKVVAEQSGFNSLSTFHRSFLKVMKVTPLQYRNNNIVVLT